MKRWLISSLAVTALALSSLPLSAQRPLLTSATIDGSSIAAVSVNPGGGASYTQVFALQYTHSQGAGDIVSARVRFGSSNVGPGTCTARYNATSGSLGLLTDAGTGWTEAAIGSGSLANSQCTLNLAASSVTLGGTNLKMVLAITFSPSFAGLKQIYLLATDAGGANTGWQTRGTWTVPPAGPAPISVSPTAGAGLTWPFTLHYSDSLGAADLSSARVRFGASNVGPGTCTARFDAVAGSVELLDDSGTSWLPGTIGSGTLANSQCTLNLTESDATVNGNDVTVVLNVTFAPTFTGLKKIYMLAASSSGGSSGWVRKGTWRPNPGPGVTSMIDLGTLGGAESFAYAVNDNGQIAGNSSLADNTTHGFFWTPTTGIVDIGTVGGASSTFSALNANGQIVGSSASDSNVDHPFSWTPSGGMVNIGSPGHAFGVNDDGLVVGDIGDEHAFAWTQAGGVVELGTLGGDESSALGVTGSGVVAGISDVVGNDSYHVFTWTQAAGMVDLGTFGGSESYPFAVMPGGHVVGYADLVGNDGYHAFVWTAAMGMVDLGTFGGKKSAARAANANGQVVGWSTFADGTHHAFSWTAAGGMIDLDTLGGSWSVARAVSLDGLIVGRSELADGTYHAFAWTPAGGMVDLGTLGGSYSFAYALNQHCQAVGRSTIASDDLTNHATVWNIAGCQTVQGASTPGMGTTATR